MRNAEIMGLYKMSPIDSIRNEHVNFDSTQFMTHCRNLWQYRPEHTVGLTIIYSPSL